KTCSIAKNDDHCTVDIGWTPPAPSNYSPFKLTVTDPSRGLDAHAGYMKVMSNYEDMIIEGMTFDSGTRHVNVEVTEPMATNYASNMHWKPIRGELLLS